MKKASQSYRGLEKLLGPRRRKLRNRIVGSKNYANLRFAIFRDVALRRGEPVAHFGLYK